MQIIIIFYLLLRGSIGQGRMSTVEISLARLIYGARISLSVGVLSVSIGAIVGTFLGIISGYKGGLLDGFIMRCADVLFAFPTFLLAIGIVAVLGGGIINVIIAIAVFSTPMFARLARSTTLSSHPTHSMFERRRPWGQVTFVLCLSIFYQVHSAARWSTLPCVLVPRY